MRGKFDCGHGRLETNFLDLLQDIEKKSNIELYLTSGFRCEECNKKVGGLPDSAHLKGLAVDIKFENNRQLYILIKTFITFGITRIGINFKNNFVHIDIDKEKPQLVIFSY